MSALAETRRVVAPPIPFPQGEMSLADYEARLIKLMQTNGNGNYEIHPDFFPLTAALALKRHQPYLTNREILKALTGDLGKMQVAEEDVARVVEAINKALALSAK